MRPMDATNATHEDEVRRLLKGTYTPSEFAKICNVSLDTVNRAIRLGKLPYIEVFGQRRIEAASFDLVVRYVKATGDANG